VFPQRRLEIDPLHGETSVILRIIPVKIHLKFRIEPEDQRTQYVELLNMMIQQLERIINSRRTKTSQRLQAKPLGTHHMLSQREHRLRIYCWNRQKCLGVE